MPVPDQTDHSPNATKDDAAASIVQLEYAGIDNAPKRHIYDAIYSALLVVLILYSMFGIVFFIALMHHDNEPLENALLLCGCEAFFLLSEIAVLVIRIRSPEIRKWPTLILNVLLLANIPFGTIVAVFGFFGSTKCRRIEDK